MTLSGLQTAAAQRTGQDVCVVAGPGSGKTRVLVERFRWLVQEKNLSPLRVLAITFTEKAATEIKQRLAAEFENAPESRSEIERAYVSTVHGFCARLLREHAIAAGLDPRFSVMDAAQSRAEIEESAHAALDQLFEERRDEFRSLLEAIYVSTHSGGRQPDLARTLIDVYDGARIAGVPPEELRGGEEDGYASGWAAMVSKTRDLLAGAPPPSTAAQQRRIDSLSEWLGRALSLAGGRLSVEHFKLLGGFPDNIQGLKRGNPLRESIVELREQDIPNLKRNLAGEFYAPLLGLLVEALQRIDRNYRQRKRELSAVDFSDLEERAIDLLRRNPEMRASMAAAFDQILMDELQDTNRLQWKLLELVRSADNFFGVGDVNQSIYGFRHADPQVFRDYRSGIEGQQKKIDELFENHRSRAAVLSAVNLIVRNARGIEPHELAEGRRFPQKKEPSIELIVATGESGEEVARTEALRIAERIRELAGMLHVSEKDGERQASLRDMAVLVRTAACLRPIESALRDFQIPYLTTGGRGFYEAREIRDLIHLLRVIANPQDEIALAGVLRSPVVGLSDEGLLRLKQAGPLATAMIRQDHSDPAGFDLDELERLRSFRKLLKRMRDARDDVAPDRLLLRAIDASGYEMGLSSRARANLDKFLGLIRDRHEAQPRSMASLLQDLEWLRGLRAEADAPPDDSSDAVRLMTIHQSKGLQFPIVFLSAMHRGPDRRKPPVCLSSGGALGVRWRNPATGKELGDKVHLQYCEALEERESDEENRLLYVGMTRAEEHLVFSFCDTKRPSSQWGRMVAGGLGVSVETFDNQAFVHQATEGLSVRVLCVDKPPERFSVPPLPSQPERETAVFLPRPERTGQHDSTAPVTAVRTFAACPRRYYLEHYVGWRETPASRGFDPEDPDIDLEEGRQQGPDATEFGREVHAILAGSPPAGASPAALELAARFRASELGRRADAASRAEREFDFLMAMDDLVLSGQIDLWFEEGGELVLVDYKTDNIDAEDCQGRAAFYALQLRLYALALSRVAGRAPDRVYLYFLRPNVAVPIDTGAASLEEAKNKTGELREAQATLSFELREGEQCSDCRFYRGLCPAGRTKPRHSRERPSSAPGPS